MAVIYLGFSKALAPAPPDNLLSKLATESVKQAQRVPVNGTTEGGPEWGSAGTFSKEQADPICWGWEVVNTWRTELKSHGILVNGRTGL